MFCLIGALAPPQDPLVLSEPLKSILFSLVSYFGPPEPARIVVLSMSNSIILGAMYLFNGSLKFEITAKRLYAASQRVL